MNMHLEFIDEMSKSEKREIKNRLSVVIEHVLKLKYIEGRIAADNSQCAFNSCARCLPGGCCGCAGSLSACAISPYSPSFHSREKSAEEIIDFIAAGTTPEAVAVFHPSVSVQQRVAQPILGDYRLLENGRFLELFRYPIGIC